MTAALASLPSGRPQRIVYFGTPQMAVAPLRALVDAGFDVVRVITGVDKRRGRGNDLGSTPVKAAALDLGLLVSHDVDDCLRDGADLGVVVAFGQLIKPPVLAELAMVNIHFSLLPRWRGAAPVERALLAGDQQTGTCLMRLDVGLDTGAILDVRRVDISATTTADELRRQLVQLGTAQLIENLQRGLGPAIEQDGEAVYAAKIRPDELRIDWSEAAAAIDRLVRLGGAWTTFRNKRLKVIRAMPGDGADLAPGELAADLHVGTIEGQIQLITVQPEGKAPIEAAAWANGARITPGERLGQDPE